VLARLDAERRTLRRDDEVIEILPTVTRLRPQSGAYHCVISSALSESTADATIAEQVAHYRALGVGFEWKLYSHDAPPDLMSRLVRHGFSIDPKEAVLVFDLHDPAPWLDDPPPCEIVRVERPEQVKQFRDAAAEIFGKDYSVTAEQLEWSLRHRSTQHVAYLAMMNGVPAAVGRLYTHPASHFGGLYGGGTRPAFRGQGFYRALVAARARAAAESGARYLIVDALPTSQPILHRLGFRRIADTWACEWEPPPS
jgi:hypothetical protein